MNEKIAVNDVLTGINGAIKMLTYGIEQANNEQFRDTLIDFNTKFINLQWEIYNIAKTKGYYIPAAPAGQADIEQVKTSIS